MLIDLNSTGCKLSLKDSERKKLPRVLLDESIAIHSQFPGSNETITFKGKIRNLEQTGQQALTGIQFLDIPSPAARRLKTFVQNMLDLTI